MFRTLLCALLMLPGAALAASSSPFPAAPPGLSITGLSVTGLSITVQPKDTAYSLARRHNLSVDALLSLNNLSSSNLAVGQVLLVSPPTYTVVRGDTAFGVAKRHNLSLDALLSLNTLSSANLRVGQVLQLSAAGTGPTSTGPAVTGPAVVGPVVTTPASTTQITSSTFSVPMTEPALTSQTYASPTLTNSTISTESNSTESLTPEPPSPLGTELPPEPLDPFTALPSPGDQTWLSTAQSLLGVPYVWGGKTRRGTDCSGFVLQVFTPLGLSLPRSSAQQAQVGLAVERDQVQSGDLVFFDTEGRGRVSHVGIALSAKSFINANSYAGKVSVDDLGSHYWASRYLGARRVLGVMAARP